MRRIRRILPILGMATVIAGLAVGSSTSGAAAYGAADRPIAEIELSANCDNPSFPLCQEVNLGGVWFWSELDTAGGQTMDYTLTFCQHGTPALPLPPGSAPGAFGHPGSGTWTTTSDRAVVQSLIFGQGAVPGGFDPFNPPAGTFYVLDFFPGAPAGQDFLAVVPTAVGHYSFRPVNGATIQTQVAP